MTLTDGSLTYCSHTLPLCSTLELKCECHFTFMSTLLCSEGDKVLWQFTVECGRQLPLELSDDITDDSLHIHLTKA